MSLNFLQHRPRQLQHVLHPGIIPLRAKIPNKTFDLGLLLFRLHEIQA
jgi:hypothetical protein